MTFFWNLQVRSQQLTHHQTKEDDWLEWDIPTLFRFELQPPSNVQCGACQPEIG